MKVMFMFFAFLNVAFFTWQADVFSLHSSGNKTKDLPKIKNVETLVLLREASKEKLAKIDAKPKPKPQPQKAPSRPKTQAKQICYALGPFDGISQAKPISEKLQDLGAFTFERLVTTESPMGYWVFLPSFDSWNDAREKVGVLEQKGIKDMFIVGRGKMKNAVSLGLYKGEDSARDRVKAIEKLGETPKIQTQFQQIDNYWIDIDVDADKDKAIRTIEMIAKSLTVLELNPRKCD